ncbi:MAG: ATP-binding cassette domain-containing protein [Candidatus Thermoplasmatota archaeon]|nr:ATP-binding cassette domain-containing protein [Candidatus Thermoplasmatota archaeon]
MWCRNYGVAELDERIYEAVLSNNDPTVISKEILSLINESNQRVDLVAIGEARDYYKYEEDLFKLNRDLIQAESENSREKIDIVQAKIQELKKSVGSKFFSYKILRRFLKRKFERPFHLAARSRAIEMLEMVNIPEPERTLDSFPHELSGGMQQRAMIAMSLATNPKMLIADEPTTALDVTTQAQILDLIKDLKNVTGSSILFITHDLAVIAEMCDRVGVMYGGNLVEEASVNDIFFNPKHPYTTGLLSSIPREFGKERRNMKLSTIPGSVPNLITPPSGCRFHPRCKFAMDVCKEKKPKLVELETGHKVACFLYSSETEENA